MTLDSSFTDLEETEVSGQRIFYAWPQPAALDFEPLYEELRRRQPRAANVNIGVALLRAERKIAPYQDSKALLDEAEACLVESFTC